MSCIHIKQQILGVNISKGRSKRPYISILEVGFLTAICRTAWASLK